jgi:hypothetical protein
MATTWRKIIVSGSNAELADLSVSGKLSITGSVFAGGISSTTDADKKLVVFDESTKQLFYTASGAGGGGGIFVSKDGGNYYATDNTLVVSGSTLQTSLTDNALKQIPASNANSKYAFMVSESAYFANHNVGHPNSLAWQTNLDNTIFNAYDANTDVSQILRTIVGVISASNGDLVESPTPNATAWNTSTVAEEATPGVDTADWNDVFVPSETNINWILPIRYLVTKGFGDGAGSALFNNVSTIYQATTDDYGITTTSNPTGYFDAGNAGSGVTVYASASLVFSDNQTITNPTNASHTYITRSFFKYTSTTDSSPLYVRDIASGTPTVIPAQYQEAKYGPIPLITDRRYADSGEQFGSVSSNANAISSSGYYRYIDVKVGFASSSTAALEDVITGDLKTIGSKTSRFITPLTLAQVETIEPKDISIVKIASSFNNYQLAVESRSLSGAPYLNSTYWSNNYEYTVRGLFKPLYYADPGTTTTVFEMDTSTAVIAVSSSGDEKFKLNNGQTIAGQKYYLNNGSFSNLATTPGLDHTASIASSAVYGLGPTYNNDDTYDGATNVVERYPTTTTWPLKARYKTWDGGGSWTTGLTENIEYHTAGTRAPAASGSLAVWLSSDGQIFSQNDADETTFKDERYRRNINGNTVLEATGSVWDSGSRLIMGSNGDLQYKPGSGNGFLVNPQAGANSPSINTNGGYGYWYNAFTSSYSNTEAKFLMREFDTGATTGKNNLVITLNSTSDLVTWADETSNKIAIGVFFEYQLTKYDDGTDTYPVLHDVKSGTTPISSIETANTAKQNPFNESVNIHPSGWNSINDTGTVITLGFNGGAKQQIDANNTKVWLVVRYIGTPSNTLQRIKVQAT